MTFVPPSMATNVLALPLCHSPRGEPQKPTLVWEAAFVQPACCEGSSALETVKFSSPAVPDRDPSPFP